MSYGSGFLSLSAADIADQMIPWCRGFTGRRATPLVFGPLDASSARVPTHMHTLHCDYQKYLQLWPDVPWEEKSAPSIGNHLSHFRMS